MKNRSISKEIKKDNHGVKLSLEMRDFLGDYHNFTNKWPSHKIAQIPEISTSKQNLYQLAKTRKGRHE